MNITIAKKGVAASLLLVAALSLTTLPLTFIICAWLILLVAYAALYTRHAMTTVIGIYAVLFVLAWVSHPLLQKMPLPFELRFLLGCIIWGGVIAVAIALFLSRTHSYEKPAS